jgi:hypothetical protein
MLSRASSASALARASFSGVPRGLAEAGRRDQQAQAAILLEQPALQLFALDMSWRQPLRRAPVTGRQSDGCRGSVCGHGDS